MAGIWCCWFVGSVWWLFGCVIWFACGCGVKATVFGVMFDFVVVLFIWCFGVGCRFWGCVAYLRVVFDVLLWRRWVLAIWVWEFVGWIGLD